MGTQGRIVAGMCLAASAGYMQSATYNYIVTPMLVGFQAPQSAAAPLRETPSIAALLVIFLAAVAAQRFGRRRVVSVAALLLIAGSLVVAAAPTLLVAVAGLALQAIGGAILLIVPLGVIAAVVSDSHARSTAFAYFSMVSPIVFVALPVLAAGLMLHLSWRVVAVIWALGGVVAFAAGRWALDPDPTDRPRQELLTPSLAGLLCVGTVQIVSHLSGGADFSTGTVIRVIVTVGAGIGLLVALRRMRTPALDVGMLRRPGFVLMLVVIGLWCFTQWGYYVTLAFEYVYGQSVFATAVLMVPVQLAAVVGARLAGRMINRMGLTAAGVWLLMLTGLSLVLTVAVYVDSSLWWVVAVTCLYALASVGAGVPMTKAVMDTADAGSESGASAYRTAAMQVGTAVGIALISTVVFAAFSSSLTSRLAAEGLDSPQDQQIAVDLRTGVTAQQESARYAVPVTQVDSINEAQQEAFLDGTAVHGWLGAGLSVATALLFWLSRRRALVDPAASAQGSRRSPDPG